MKIVYLNVFYAGKNVQWSGKMLIVFFSPVQMKILKSKWCKQYIWFHSSEDQCLSGDAYVEIMLALLSVSESLSGDEDSPLMKGEYIDGIHFSSAGENMSKEWKQHGCICLSSIG